LIPKGSKEERAGAVAYMVNRGQVAVPKDAPWLKAFIAELQGFPLGRYADQVDAFVHALSYVGRPSEFANAPDLEVGTQVIDTIQNYLSDGGGLVDLDAEMNSTPDFAILSPALTRNLRRYQ